MLSCRRQGVLLQADKCLAAQKGVSGSPWPKGPQGPQGCRGGIRKEDPSGSERGCKEAFSPQIQINQINMWLWHLCDAFLKSKLQVQLMTLCWNESPLFTETPSKALGMWLEAGISTFGWCYLWQEFGNSLHPDRTWLKQYIINFYCCLTMSVSPESSMKFIRISFSQKDAEEQNYLIA